MKHFYLGILCVLCGALLHAFKRLEPITADSLLMPFWTFFVIGACVNIIAVLFWISIKEEICTSPKMTIVWYLILVSWPLATDQMISLITSINYIKILGV